LVLSPESADELLDERMGEPLRISTLSAVANLSRSHYTTLFKHVAGYAPFLYLNHLRIQRAVQLLNSTNLSIKAISD
jgi:AraC-like DNA-binding protein